jgi:general secretion pathway protein C
MRGRSWVPLVAVLALLALLGWRVQAAWQLWQQTQAQLAASAQPSQPAQTQVDVGAVQALALFTGAPTQTGTASSPTQLLANLLATDLNLQLEGVVLATPASESRALIVSGSEQRSYKVGESLPVGANVSLQEVAQDHVVLNNNGADEVLWLYEAGKAKRVSASGSTVRPIRVAPTARSAARTEQGAASNATVLNELPAQGQRHPAVVAALLAEIVQIEPEHANGQQIGYRLMPTAKLKEFMQLGFKAGDVATAVNGIALNDAANLPKLYGVLNGATDVTFSLLRDQQPLTLQVKLKR